MFVRETQKMKNEMPEETQTKPENRKEVILRILEASVNLSIKIRVHYIFLSLQWALTSTKLDYIRFGYKMMNLRSLEFA